MLPIRDRKDPRNKTGNDQRIPLFAATGFDAFQEGDTLEFYREEIRLADGCRWCFC